jgi:aspartyl-tRNA(Asn)/glutamyl-tRNA(Gln) amidotransferase subunit A
MPVDVPDLELCRVAHTVIVMAEAIQRARWVLDNPQFHRQLGLDVRVAFDASKFFTAADFVQAQCIRRRVSAHLQSACAHVHVLVTPATPSTAPLCHPGALQCGESDLTTAAQLMKYTQLSNLVGSPAVVVPVGMDEKGLPIGCAFFCAGGTALPFQAFVPCMLQNFKLQDCKLQLWVKMRMVGVTLAQIIMACGSE